MAFIPFILIPPRLPILLSLALLGGGAYLLNALSVGIAVGTWYLVASLTMLIWTCIGRWLVLALFRRLTQTPRPGDQPGDAVLTPISIRPTVPLPALHAAPRRLAREVLENG